jgi:UDP-glucose 4-epimerase
VPHERILVTGASGFVGSEIVRQAAAAGYTVRALSRHTPTPSLAAEHLSVDILNRDALREAMRGVDSVVHAAALAHVFSPTSETDRQLDLVNHVGARNVAEAAAAAGVRNYLLISSVSVYGHADTPGGEDAPCRPEGPYGWSKLRGEQATAEIASREGLNLRIVRLATVYGEEDPGNVGRLIRSIARGRFVWLGDGANRKSLIHRDDAAAACLLALRHPGTLPPLNVTSPAVTMNQLVSTIEQCVGRRVPSVRIPARLGRIGAAVGHRVSAPGPISRIAGAIEKWLRHDEYDGRRFEAATGFRPSIDLRDGIAREVRWLRMAARLP